MVRGCRLLAALVQKAARTGHLGHTERLSLLYTLGHCGDAGRAYLHQVIGLCSNYDPRVTESWVRRLEPGRRALRCSTLKEWLRDHLPGVTCPCLPRRPNPSPVDLLPAPKPEPMGQPPEGWDAVAGDLFGPEPED
jgi:hypothetical protein